MTPTSPSPSVCADQPPHEPGQPVNLACLDLTVSMERIDFNDPILGDEDGPVFQIRQMPVRNAHMDSYGVGYDLELPNGRSWQKCSLSRRRFGTDNFDLQLSVNSMVKEGPEGVKSPFQSNRMQMSARVWCWEKDIELAQKALLASAKKVIVLMGKMGALAEEKLEAATISQAEVPKPKKSARP